MTDVHTSQQRSFNMSSVRNKNTRPEKLVRSTLHNLGYRFCLHSEKLPGKPDIILPKWNLIIFVHGCFWHQHKGCKKAVRPQSNEPFWDKKLDENIRRDGAIVTKLRRSGWRVAIIWECETMDKNFPLKLKKLVEW